MTNSIDNFVITSLITPEALATFSIGSIAIFTEENVFPEDFRIYTILDSIINDFGYNSNVYKMADKIFKQQINFKLTNNSRLVVVKVIQTSGTRGKFITSNLTSNFTNIKAINNGDLTITIDGVDNNLINLDFTKCKDLTSIIQVFEKKKLLVDYVLVNGILTITSKNVGADSSIVLKQLSGGTGTDLSVLHLFNTAGGTSTIGTDANETETITTILNNIKNNVLITAFTTTIEMDIEEVKTLQQSLTNDIIFIYNVPNKDDFIKIKEKIYDVAGGFKKVLNFIPITGLTDDLNGKYLRSAVLSQLSGNDTFTRQKRTLHGKSLSGVDINNAKNLMNQSIKDLASENGIHSYGFYSKGFGARIFYSDKPYEPETLLNFINIKGQSQIWLANLLGNKTINKTNLELQSIKGLYQQQILEIFRLNNVFSPLNEDETFDISFGNQDNAKQNLIEKGYYVFIPDVNNIIGKKIPIQVAIKMSETVLQFSLELFSVN